MKAANPCRVFTILLLLMSSALFAQGYMDVPSADTTLMSVSPPDEDHMVTIVGAAGATIPHSKIFIFNLDTGNTDIVDSDENGAFDAGFFAPYGSVISVSQDPLHTLFEEVISSEEADLAFSEWVLPGALIFPRPQANTRMFVQAGHTSLDPSDPTLAFPAWQITGEIDKNQYQPGDTVQVSGSLDVLTDNPDANVTQSFSLMFFLERVASDRGDQMFPVSRFASVRMTPTGFPIEENQTWEEPDIFNTHEVNFQLTENGRWEGPFNLGFNLPEWLEPGYYQLRFTVIGQHLVEDPKEPNTTGWFLGVEPNRFVPSPAFRVGNPDPPRMFMHLLTNQFHNGSRGIRALEDFDRFGLASIMGAASDVLVIPMSDPQTGAKIEYNLDTFIPQQMWAVQTAPKRQMPTLNLPSGQLDMSIQAPSGATRELGPSPFTQLSDSTATQSNGWTPVSLGGQMMNNVIQLRTMDPQFDMTFDEYGKHTIHIDMSVDDLGGNTWTGSGTFEVWVARPLVLDTTVLPGMVFEQGDVLSTSLVVSPAGPAEVEFRYMITPDSVAEDRHTQVAKGYANRFGNFQGTSIVLDEAGEYRADVTASYWDEEGVLWMGSRSWGGVVARPDPPIVAHGRRGIDESPEISPQWFTRADLEIPETLGHFPFPYSSGDIQWLNERDAAVPMARLQVLTPALEDVIRPRYKDMHFHGTPLDVDEAINAGSIPFVSYGPTEIEPNVLPSSVDLWSYTYISSQRPLVRVRENVQESSVINYWRFGEQYNRQVGVGPMGDLVNDIKFQYIGAVLRGDALPRPEYAIHGSLFVLVPHFDQGGVSRTFPPFQGNGGGPSGGPIITHKGEDIDILMNLRAMRPGSIFEVGDTFSMAGALGPSLPGKVSYTVTAPSGAQTAHSGQANPVGYYYQTENDFTLTEPGTHTVDFNVMFEGQTSAGQVTEPFPSGDVLGSDDGRFYFYVVDKDSTLLANNLPRESQFEPEVNGDFTNSNHFIMDIETTLPEGYSAVEAHVTTMMPGTILESKELDTSGPLIYTLDVSTLGLEVPNLDWENGLADLLTTSIFVEARDAENNPVHLGRVINFHGAEIFNLDIPKPEAKAFSINSGLNDAWVHVGAANQGMFLTAFPNLSLMFAAWFSFDSVSPPGSATAVVGAPDQRWVTALGPYSGTTASLKAELTAGGRFNSNDGVVVQDTDYGTIDIDFSSCNSANVDFNFPSADESGSFTMNRVLSDNIPVCEGIVEWFD